MAELRIPRAHSNDWYDHLVTLQDGYAYPWQSTIGPHSGDEGFNTLLQELIKPTDAVLEIGCGQGELALQLAGQCKTVIAYDRVPAYIALAEQQKQKRGLSNVEFKVHDALDPADHDVHLPGDDQAFDLIVCRLGPHHWIQEARRVCRDGARLIQLSPMEEPIPAWSTILPHVMHYENSGRYSGAGSIHQSVENRLHQAGLTLDSGWGFDVPEVFATPQALYQMITWGLPPAKTPSFEDVAQKLDMIFERFAEHNGIVLRHCRYLWTALIT